VRVLPQWTAKDLPVHVVYAGHRLLPTRVRAFIDFAVSYNDERIGIQRVEAQHPMRRRGRWAAPDAQLER
jgi:hypothetical protein